MPSPSASDEYFDGWQHRLEAESANLQSGILEKRQAADRLAKLLAEKYGVRQVFLIGSLARDEGRPDSDIDLAVEGLSPDRYFEALADLWVMLPRGTELDLIPLEFASTYMVETAYSDGIALYVGV